MRVQNDSWTVQRGFAERLTLSGLVVIEIMSDDHEILTNAEGVR